MYIGQNIPGSYTMAGTCIPTGRAKLFFGATTAGNYDSFKSVNGTPYQTPTGKKLICRAVRAMTIAAAIANVSMAVGDASVANGAAPSGKVDLTGVIACSPATAGTYQEVPCYFEFAASKYPLISCASGTVYWMVLCEEVDA